MRPSASDLTDDPRYASDIFNEENDSATEDVRLESLDLDFSILTCRSSIICFK